jgi:hypothetical protein
MVSFHLKYIRANKFVIVPFFAILDALAFTFGGFLSKSMGIHSVIALSFCAASLGSYTTIVSVERVQVIFLVATKLGIGVAYSQVYALTA